MFVACTCNYNWNPTIGLRCDNGNCDSTSSDIQTGTRFVWSGVLGNANTYNFAAVNGTDSSNPAYVNCNGNGECAEYSGSDTPNKFQSMIQTNPGYGFTPNQPNVCTSQLNAQDSSFSGMFSDTYTWQVPSYPVMLTVSGCTSCTAGTTDNYIVGGASAVSSPIPSFSTSYILWSSSLRSASYGWYFDGGDVNDLGLDGLVQVRCVSPAW